MVNAMPERYDGSVLGQGPTGVRSGDVPRKKLRQHGSCRAIGQWEHFLAAPDSSLLPAIVGMVAQALYNIVDRVFVGQAIGTLGIAGTTLAFPFMLVLMAFSMLIGYGAAALVSIRLGERRRDEAEHVLGHAVILLLLVAVLLTAVGLAFLDPLLRAVGASEDSQPYAREYLQIIVAGSIFQTLGFGLNALIRGEGNPRVAMMTLLIGALLNTILGSDLPVRAGMGDARSRRRDRAVASGLRPVGRELLRARQEPAQVPQATSPAAMEHVPGHRSHRVAHVCDADGGQRDEHPPLQSAPHLRWRPRDLGHGDRACRRVVRCHARVRAQPGGSADHRLQLRCGKLRPSAANPAAGRSCMPR